MLDNSFSQRINAIVGKLREMRRSPYWPHLYVVKEDGEPALRMWALSCLIEDRTDGLPSYREYLETLRNKVSYLFYLLISFTYGNYKCSDIDFHVRSILALIADSSLHQNDYIQSTLYKALAPILKTEKRPRGSYEIETIVMQTVREKKTIACQ